MIPACPFPSSAIGARLFGDGGRDFLSVALKLFNGWMQFLEQFVSAFDRCAIRWGLILQLAKHRLLPRRQLVYPPEAGAPARKVQPNAENPRGSILTLAQTRR
jgi:hypothetical protein